MGSIDIDADAVRVAPRHFDERGRHLGNRLQVDVTAKVMLLAQLPRDVDDQLLRVVRAADDAAAEEEPLDEVALVEIEREPHHLVRREARALHIAGSAADAVVAVVEARIREQHLQQRNAASIRCIGMADARAARGAHARAAARILPRRPAARARGVMLRRVGEEFEFVLQIHVFAKTLAAFHAFERENSNIHAARHDDVVGRTPGRSEAIEW